MEVFKIIPWHFYPMALIPIVAVVGMIFIKDEEIDRKKASSCSSNYKAKN